MPSPTIESASELLFQAFRDRGRLADLIGDLRPQTQEDAYACQEHLVERLTSHYGGKVIGYKIGCTSVVAQRYLQVREPFYGRMLSAFAHDSPSRLQARDFFMRIVEAEFAFRFARDLPPSPRALEGDGIADALACVLPGIEIVDSRFKSWTTVGAPSLIADNGCHGAWVKGVLVTDWRSLELGAQEVAVTVNDEVRLRGSGSAVLGHPLNALEWLVRRLHARGIGIKAGEYVTTGITTDVYDARPGDRIVAEFGPLGTVELAFD